MVGSPLIQPAERTAELPYVCDKNPMKRSSKYLHCVETITLLLDVSLDFYSFDQPGSKGQLPASCISADPRTGQVKLAVFDWLFDNKGPIDYSSTKRNKGLTKDFGILKSYTVCLPQLMGFEPYSSVQLYLFILGTVPIYSNITIVHI